MKYNLTTLKIYFKQGLFWSNSIKIQENSVQILKIHFKYFISVSKYIWFGKGAGIGYRNQTATVV